jgi:hypothetical protein
MHLLDLETAQQKMNAVPATQRLRSEGGIKAATGNSPYHPRARRRVIDGLTIVIGF